MEPAKNVAIIGAGPAGIVALKTIKEYGHNVTCFEKEVNFGGIWNITERDKAVGYENLDEHGYGTSSSYNSLLMNTSAVMSEFSDFPIHSEVDFLQSSEYFEYLGKYMEHFQLKKYLKLSTTVTGLKKDTTGWVVHYKPTSDGNEQEVTELFDFVVIATGPCRFPLIPDIEGLSSFPGLVLHTGQVRNEGLLFPGKSVLILGIGNSSMELASAALKNGVKKVCVSVTETPARRKHFAGKRYVPDPRQSGRLIPFDIYSLTMQARDSGPDAMFDFLKLWTKPLNKSQNHITKFPNEGLVCTDVDLIYDMMTTGIFEKVGGVTKVTPDTIELDDGMTLRNVDMIICGTGYSPRFPMIDEIWPREEQSKCELYHHMLPLESKLDGLVFVNTAITFFSLMVIMEIQARYICEKIFTRDYNHQGQLFTDTERQEMNKEIQLEKQSNLTFDRKFNFLVDAPGYNMMLAKEIGCCPPDYKSFLQPGSSREDVEFGVALGYGPIISSHYRLNGPKCWDGAKQHILDVAKHALGEHFDKLVFEYLRK